MEHVRLRGNEDLYCEVYEGTVYCRGVCSEERAVSFFTVENGVHTGRAKDLVTEFVRCHSVLQKVRVFFGPL